MTPKQLAAYIEQLHKEADILSQAQKVLHRLAGVKAQHALPAKLRQAAKVRVGAALGVAPPKSAQVITLAEQLAAQGIPVTTKALAAAGIRMTPSGMIYHLHRAGYRKTGGSTKTVWSPTATKAKPKAAKKGHQAETLAAIVKQAGKPMAFGELQAAAQQMGMRVNAQAFAAACRYKYLKREGDSYTLGRNGQGAAL